MVLLLVCNHSYSQVNTDSIRQAQQQYRDSIKQANERRADSLAAVRSYLKSKQYNDSIDAVRKARKDSIDLYRQKMQDSIAAERKRINDSLTLVREMYQDSVREAIANQKAEQQRITDSTNAARQRMIDSMNAVRDYLKSDRYKDSVAAIRQRQIDSSNAARQHYIDSMNTVRQQYNDSIQKYIDSTKQARQVYLDSVKLAQKNLKDSLAIVKEKRELAREEREKEKEKKKQLQLELKIKKKQDAFTNEDMLKKKWSFMRRGIQNTFTRYNYYYNANLKLKEAEDNIFRSATDDLDKFIPLFPYDPLKDSAKLSSDMDSLVKRIAVGIQIHDPRAKWQDDLYMVLGKAFYYKGDFKNAKASFQYIVAEAERREKEELKKQKNKDKINSATNDIIVQDESGLQGALSHKVAKNEAIIWLARTFITEKDYGKARILLDLANSPNLPERLKGELAFANALYYNATNDQDATIDQLKLVVANKNIDNRLRVRSGFLAGQMMQDNGQWDSAVAMYDAILPLFPPIELDFKARINKIMSAINSENINATDNIKTLEALTDELKYKEYYDQIFYALGNAYSKVENPTKAIENYEKSLEKNTGNQQQKSLSFFGLGNELYDNQKFIAAKSAYDSTLALINPDIQPMYDVSLQRSSGLAIVAEPGNIVAELDSLLTLANMTEREQKSVIRKYIRDLENAKNASNSAASSPAMTANPNNWYFNNTALVQKGESAFKTKWGNRPLKDNWRINGGTTNNFSSGDASDDEDTDNAGINEEELLAKIPKTQAQKDSVTTKLLKAYFDLGNAYFKIEDYENAVKTYDKLIALQPNHDSLDLILYNKYVSYIHQNNPALSDENKNKLIQQFPNSQYTKRITAIKEETNSTATTNATVDIENHYSQTYQLLIAGEYKQVIARTQEAKSIYPAAITRYQNKYNLVEAIAFAGIKDYDKAGKLLTEYVAVTPNDTLRTWAQHILDYINDTKTTPAVSDSTTKPLSTAELSYTVDKNTTHFVIFTSGTIDGKIMGLKAGITDYNMLNKPMMSLTAAMNGINPETTVIIIKQFDNAKQAKDYLNEINHHKNLTKEFKGTNQLQSAVISQVNYTRLLQNKNLEEYLSFYKKNY